MQSDQNPEVIITPAETPRQLNKKIPSLTISIPSHASRTPPATPPSIPIIVIPPVITTPSVTPTGFHHDLESACIYFALITIFIINFTYCFLVTQSRVIYSSGTPLRTPNHQPELHTYLTGTQHIDGSSIALSHSYPNVSVIFADIVGTIYIYILFIFHLS